MDVIDKLGEKIKNSNCDLYMINIGTNDIRYNILNEKKYINNMKKIVRLIGSDKNIILLSPYRTTDRDKNLKTDRNEKKSMYNKYDYELINYAKDKDNICYKDVNKYIRSAILDNGEDVYLLDGVHPNDSYGIKLYFYALFR